MVACTVGVSLREAPDLLYQIALYMVTTYDNMALGFNYSSFSLAETDGTNRMNCAAVLKLYKVHKHLKIDNNPECK